MDLVVLNKELPVTSSRKLAKIKMKGAKNGI